MVVREKYLGPNIVRFGFLCRHVAVDAQQRYVLPQKATRGQGRYPHTEVRVTDMVRISAFSAH
jgi:hypothetical protein